MPLESLPDALRRRCLATMLCAVAVLSLGLHSAPGQADGAGGQPTLPTVQLQVGEHVLRAELAVSAQQRYLGLGNRRTLPEDAAMLFVYPDTRMLTFTMRDTLLPLSIAFLDADLTILEILDMDVGPGQLFPASQPARYALEVNQGWFERHGITVGTQLRPADGALK